MSDLDVLAADLGRRFEALGCRAGLQVIDLTTGRTLALPGLQSFASKTGSLFGRIRHEVGLVEDAGGRPFAFAVLTQAAVPFAEGEWIEALMGTGLNDALRALGARLP